MCIRDRFWTGAFAVFAAIRGNWPLFFAMQVLLVMPGEWFGTTDYQMGPAAAVISAVIMAVRAAAGRKFRYLIPVAGALAAVLGGHALSDGHVHPLRPGAAVSNQVFDEPGDGLLTDADAAARITAAMAAAKGTQRPAADYVMAQLAYLRHDWTTAAALTARLQPDRFAHGPFTAMRVLVLRNFAAGRQGLVPMPAFMAVDTAFTVAFVLVLASVVMIWRLRGRARRIDDLARRLGALRPAREAAA